MSDGVNLEEIYDSLKGRGLYEIQEVVGIWEFRIDKLEDFKLRIKVTRGPEGMYLATTNYILPKETLVSPHLQKTAHEALRDTLNRFFNSFNVLDITKHDFRPNDLF